MRPPRLSPAVERRSPTTAPAGPIRGEAVTPQICNIKLCNADADCSSNGACTKCNSAMGVCVVP